MSIGSIITGIGAAAAGIILIAAVLFAMKHLSKLHLPGAIEGIVLRLFMIAGYAGGVVLSVSLIGTLWTGLVNWIAGFFGGIGSGTIPYIIIVIAGFTLLGGFLLELIFAPNAAAVMTAVALPLVLMLVPGGILHQFYATTAAPAQALANSFSAWLGGL
jgi:hypothetical protein